MRTGAHGRKPASDDVMMQLLPPGWAWEWMRRVPAYIKYACAAYKPSRRVVNVRPFVTVIEAHVSAQQNEWGLYFGEEPERFYGRGAVFWRPDVDPSILPVTAIPASTLDEPGAIDVERLQVATTVLRFPRGPQHVLFCDGIHAIQLEVTHGTVLEGPVRLALDVHGMEALRDGRFLTAERLGTLTTNSRFSAALLEAPPQADRWLLWLKAYEMEREGLQQAEIAARLYNAEHVAKTLDRGISRWPLSRVARALKNAESMVSGGYLKILNGDLGRGTDKAEFGMS